MTKHINNRKIKARYNRLMTEAKYNNEAYKSEDSLYYVKYLKSLI